MLYVVATPIGNLEDITLRALTVLREVDVIFAEDTRRTRSLMSHHSVPLNGRSVVSCHEHNETSRIQMLFEHLDAGRNVAIVTDAGTPGISDPGFALVKGARERGYSVVPIPGVCAAIAALSASGLPTDRFTFVGFPPKKSGARTRWLDELRTAPGTLILYAAARDVPKVLDALVTTRDDPKVAVFRELTKKFEECMYGSASDVVSQWRENPRKGEVTLVVGRPTDVDFEDADLLNLLRSASVKDVHADTGISKRRLYQLALTLKDSSDA